MSIHRLPGRIAAVMVGTVVVLVITVATSVLWMTQAMDDQSRRHSGESIHSALADVLSQVRSTTLDYAKRDETARRVAAGDLRWLRHHIGTSAEFGDLVQLAVLWGGPLSQNVGWTAAGGSAPRSGVLDPGTIALAEAGIRALPLDAYRGATFFVRRNDEVYALAAARIEREPGSREEPARDGDLARLALGLRLDDGLVRRIGERALLDGMEITRHEPEGRRSLPLMGGDGNPVAHLAWTPRLEGTALLHRMLPPLALVTALAAGLVLAGMALVRRGARELVAAERRSFAAARTDPLTGLPNRAAFSAALAGPAGPGERAVLFLDLNGFKRVNDSIGHAAGDHVIVAAAERLGRLRDPDCHLARIGGDEFVFLLGGLNAGFRAEWLAQAAERALTAPLDVMGHRLRVGVAIGWATQDDEALSGEALVHRADLAMAEAKRRQGAEDAGPVGWDALIEDADRDARAIEAALRESLGSPGQIWVAYQPIAAVPRRGDPRAPLAGGRELVRAEALARWTSPSLGSVPPDRFIAVAERSGLIMELGRHILRIVCDDLAAHPGLAASVNVSPRQLVAPTFVPELLEAVARRGIHPSRLEIEMTEQVVVDDPRRAARALRELHEAGFTTALDDFGTGFSSIGTLQQMEFDALKIDRSFVSGFPGQPARLKLLDAMIQAAHALGLTVVCEGIETAEEMDLLADLGCDLAQGWHLDRPMAIEALVARWLAPAPGERAGAA